MEAPVAMRESMTTTMPSPPDWRSVVFIFVRVEEERRLEGQRHPSTKTETRERPVALELAFLSKLVRETKRTKTACAGGAVDWKFSLPISFDPGPHLGREGEKTKRVETDLKT
jgi:hypothetical protein